MIENPGSSVLDKLRVKTSKNKFDVVMRVVLMYSECILYHFCISLPPILSVALNTFCIQIAEHDLESVLIKKPEDDHKTDNND